MCQHVLGAVPWCLVGVQALQPGSSARHPHKYLDLILQLQCQIFVFSPSFILTGLGMFYGQETGMSIL